MEFLSLSLHNPGILFQGIMSMSEAFIMLTISPVILFSTCLLISLWGVHLWWGISSLSWQVFDATRSLRIPHRWYCLCGYSSRYMHCCYSSHEKKLLSLRWCSHYSCWGSVLILMNGGGLVLITMDIMSLTLSNARNLFHCILWRSDALILFTMSRHCIHYIWVHFNWRSALVLRFFYSIMVSVGLDMKFTDSSLMILSL